MDNLAASLNLLMADALFGTVVCFLVGTLLSVDLLVGVGVLLIFAAIGAHLLSMRVEGW